jgi:hypothetical protein
VRPEVVEVGEVVLLEEAQEEVVAAASAIVVASEVNISLEIRSRECDD